jgi:hypothetical protein
MTMAMTAMGHRSAFRVSSVGKTISDCAHLTLD